MEAKLQKLKVPELKELLTKHNLPHTGKKDDLIKRLMENNVSVDDDQEELTEPPVENDTMTAPATESVTAPKPSNEPTTTESSSTPAASATEALTPDQQAMKARAERFGIPFNPNPVKTQIKPAATTTTPAASASTAPKPAETKAAPAKKTAIDKAPLGIDEETLAKRAAKFGIPEKKKDEKASPAATASPAPAAAKPSTTKPAVEITPEMAAKLAEEEEKKRKRAEKFGSVSKPETNGAAPDAKKAKV